MDHFQLLFCRRRFALVWTTHERPPTVSGISEKLRDGIQTNAVEGRGRGHYVWIWIWIEEGGPGVLLKGIVVLLAEDLLRSLLISTMTSMICSRVRDCTAACTPSLNEHFMTFPENVFTFHLPQTTKIPAVISLFRCWGVYPPCPHFCGCVSPKMRHFFCSDLGCRQSKTLSWTSIHLYQCIKWPFQVGRVVFSVSAVLIFSSLEAKISTCKYLNLVSGARGQTLALGDMTEKSNTVANFHIGSGQTKCCAPVGGRDTFVV